MGLPGGGYKPFGGFRIKYIQLGEKSFLEFRNQRKHFLGALVTFSLVCGRLHSLTQPVAKTDALDVYMIMCIKMGWSAFCPHPKYVASGSSLIQHTTAKAVVTVGKTVLLSHFL